MASAVPHQEHPTTAHPKYEYERIDLATDAIRLLRILKGPYDSPVRCHIFESYLDRSEGIPYEALSYTWGDLSVEPVTIDIVDEASGATRSLQVYPNLYEILRHLRQPDEDRVLWVDAVCIDQSQQRHQERMHQVGQMTLVYKNAERVIVWLGDLHTDMEMLMAFAQKLDGRALASSNRFPGSTAWIEQFPVQMRMHGSDWDSQYRQVSSAMIDLLKRPWFRRTWIIQEVASAKSGVVMCGLAGKTMSVPMRTFALLPSLLKVTHDQHIQAILDVMSVAGQSRRGWWNERRDLKTLLMKFQGSECSDPRDSVYALLGICSDFGVREIIKPDYSPEVTPEFLRKKTWSYIIFSEVVDEQIRRLPGDSATFLKALNHPAGLAQWTLEWACKNGSGTTAQRLLDLRETKCVALGSEWSPLAVEAGSDLGRIRRTLSSEVVDVNACVTGSEYTLLHTAVKNGHEAVVRALLTRRDINNNSRAYGDTPLHIAIKTGQASVARDLIAHNNTDVNLPNSYGTPPLLYAIKKGQTFIARDLIAHNNTDVNLPDSYGTPPLLCAIKEGQTFIARDLIAHNNTDVNLPDSYGTPPLLRAIKAGQTSIARDLIAHNATDVNLSDSYGIFPLLCAIKAGQTFIARDLIAHNAIDVNLSDSDGIPPLLRAMMNRKADPGLAEMLRQHKDIDAKLAWALHPDNLAPLSLAVIRGDRDKFDQIFHKLESSRGRNLHESVTNEALHWALKTRTSSGLEFAMAIWGRNGEPVDVNWKDGSGDTLLGILSKSHPLEKPRLASISDHWSYWRQAGVFDFTGHVVYRSQSNLNMTTRCDGHHGISEMTPLKIAAIYGHGGMVSRLLRIGGPNTSETKDHDPRRVIDLEAGMGECCGTPLWAAVSRGHSAIAEELLKNGAERESKGWHAAEGDSNPTMAGVTPLWQAVHLGNVRMIKLLISHGADLRTTGRALHQTATGLALDEEERTLMEEARFHGFHEIAELLSVHEAANAGDE